MQQSGDPLRIQVFNTLEDAILNGSYKEGDSLNELRLSKSLGVSRTPVREALMQLELEGLVKNIPNKGAVVVGVSEQDVEDIYEIRIRTEGLAARLCAEKITDEELEELEQCMALQEYYLKRTVCSSHRMCCRQISQDFPFTARTPANSSTSRGR